MNKINIELIIKLINLYKNDNHIIMLINNLKDYGVFVSEIEKKMKNIDFNTKRGIFQASQLDYQRREYHDIAIYSLNELNKISEENFNEKIYYGKIEDKYRNEIAQAIMGFCKAFLELK